MAKNLYIGIDVGGTKIAAGLLSSTGKILGRAKIPTPKKAKPKEIVKLIAELIDLLLKENHQTRSCLCGIGLGVPGIVDNKNRITVTPNMNLAGVDVVGFLRKKFATKIALGNDVNVGVLGEQWLGAAKKAQNVVGIFPGTGIGGGVITHGKLLTGAHGAAAEIGHMVLDVNGPQCTCGNYGCFEALAGRWAIERDIRQAIKDGEKSIIKKLVKGKIKTIKSKLLRKALKKKDPLVTSVMKRMAKNLGLACVSLRHVFDPELIVLGGGVIEACGSFILPIVEKTIAADPFFAKLSPCRVSLSRLGDDAIIVGAVALVKHE